MQTARNAPSMRVVLGVGGSADGMDAMRRTVDRVAETGDDLTVAVLENPATDRPPDAVAAAVREEIAASEVEAEIVQLSGDPGPALTEFAADGEFDCIVLGGGRRSPMGKITLGQIAEFVILNADRTVTLVR